MKILPRNGHAWCVAAACCLFSVAASAQTTTTTTTPTATTTTTSPPTQADQLVQATQAAEDAAKAARDAAVASQHAAEALAAAIEKGPPNQPPPPLVAPPPLPSYWNYQLGLNLISDTGNATAFAGKVGGKAMGHWSDWLLTMAADAAYGQAEQRGASGYTTTALNAEGLVRGDRKFGDHFAVYLLGGAGTDHVNFIDYLAYGELGVSIIWYQKKETDFTRTLVRTDVGFRYTKEVDYLFFPPPVTPPASPAREEFIDRPNGGNIYAPRIAFEFDYAITKTTLFSENAEVLEDVVDTADVRFTSVTAISAAIAKGFSVSLSFKVRYIGVPAEYAVNTYAANTDTELAAGLTWAY